MATETLTYKPNITKSNLILSQKRNEIRTISSGLIPEEVLIHLDANNISIMFKYSVNETQKLEKSLEKNSIQIFVGRFTSKLTEVTLSYSDLSGLEDLYSKLIVGLKELMSNQNSSAIKRSYLIIIEFLKHTQNKFIEIVTSSRS